VHAIQNQLANARADLDRLQIQAEAAAERVNGAREDLDAANATLRRRHQALAKADAAVDEARGQLGAAARTSMQGDIALLPWASLVRGTDPNELLHQSGIFASVSASLQGKYENLGAAERVATAGQRAAAAAQRTVKLASERATSANRAAAAAVTSQTTAVDSYAQRRSQLVSQLATAQKISVTLARQRQLGLEARERARRAAAARKAQLALIHREAVQRAKEQAAARAAKVERARLHAAERLKAQRSAAHRRRAAERAAARAPKHKVHHAPVKHKSSAKRAKRSPVRHKVRRSHGSGASAAIAFARRQLGEPYVFGAAGPNTWDCSGLTMRAWQAAGVNLGHFTGTQYASVRHVSESQLRRGDLIFYATNRRKPSTIFHVALYIGGGQMIQAPRPGRNVEIRNVYYWMKPAFFGRP
jgi:cell wall-associated NlpC family hydrolase